MDWMNTERFFAVTTPSGIVFKIPTTTWMKAFYKVTVRESYNMETGALAQSVHGTEFAPSTLVPLARICTISL